VRLPFLKEKPDEVAAVMRGHVLGFVDGLQLSGVRDQKLFLPELYLLGHWLQIACVISAGGGATDRVMNILSVYSKQVLPLSTVWLVERYKLSASFSPAFQKHVTTHGSLRRNEYDTALRSPKGTKAVADIAIPYLITAPVTSEIAAEASDDLANTINNLVNVGVSRLKGIV